MRGAICHLGERRATELGVNSLFDRPRFARRAPADSESTTDGRRSGPLIDDLRTMGPPALVGDHVSPSAYLSVCCPGWAPLALVVLFIVVPIWMGSDHF
jgi:hypothetical protein